MSRMHLSLRPASAADFRAWAGRDPDPAWHIDWEGVLIEQDGEPVAIGVVSLDHYGRVWAWTDVRAEVPPIALHRPVVAMLDLLRQRGVTAVHCYRNEDIPGAERWLRRLGFVPAPEIGGDGDKPVWKCQLISN